jgi:cytochrome bd-type quinol oxidase subunit 2
MFDFLDKKHTIAGAGFNRWLMPPAALAVHLCIGMAYGFSVFGFRFQKPLASSKASLAQLMSTFSLNCLLPRVTGKFPR